MILHSLVVEVVGGVKMPGQVQGVNEFLGRESHVLDQTGLGASEPELAGWGKVILELS